ncbi:MAG: DUF4169 family protein [Pseudomonadota bacterium]
MGDLVNLNKFRKAKKKEQKEKSAAANRVNFGLPKSVRESTHTDNTKTYKSHTNKRLEPADPEKTARRDDPSDD